jgi:hypothetical protein
MVMDLLESTINSKNECHTRCAVLLKTMHCLVAREREGCHTRCAVLLETMHCLVAREREGYHTRCAVLPRTMIHPTEQSMLL